MEEEVDSDEVAATPTSAVEAAEEEEAAIVEARACGYCVTVGAVAYTTVLFSTLTTYYYCKLFSTGGVATCA